MNQIIEEMFDIVDEHDVPTREVKSRMEVHAQMKDWHRVTGIYIVNDKKQLLCQRRSMLKDVDPGIWQNHFGGHVKSGESYEENAVNEVLEEIGLVVAKAQLQYLGKIKSEQHLHWAAVFVMRWNGLEGELLFNDGEVEEVKWMSVEEYVLMQQRLGRTITNINTLMQGYLDGDKN